MTGFRKTQERMLSGRINETVVLHESLLSAIPVLYMTISLESFRVSGLTWVYKIALSTG